MVTDSCPPQQPTIQPRGCHIEQKIEPRVSTLARNPLFSWPVAGPLGANSMLLPSNAEPYPAAGMNLPKPNDVQ